MYNFFFLRHGKVAEEFRGIFYGQLDVPLSKEGKLESERVVEELLKLPITAVFSSPLTRALYPATLLAKEKDVPLVIREEIKEINYGDWTGKARELIYKEPLYWERLKKDTLAPPKGESIRELRQRARSFWKELTTYKPGNYVIFSHGGFIRALLCELLHLTSEYFFAFEIYHLKVHFLTLHKDGIFVLKGMNLEAFCLPSLINSSYW